MMAHTWHLTDTDAVKNVLNKFLQNFSEKLILDEMKYSSQIIQTSWLRKNIEFILNFETGLLASFRF